MLSVLVAMLMNALKITVFGKQYPQPPPGRSTDALSGKMLADLNFRKWRYEIFEPHQLAVAAIEYPLPLRTQAHLRVVSLPSNHRSVEESSIMPKVKALRRAKKQVAVNKKKVSTKMAVSLPARRRGGGNRRAPASDCSSSSKLLVLSDKPKPSSMPRATRGAAKNRRTVSYKDADTDEDTVASTSSSDASVAKTIARKNKKIKQGASKASAGGVVHPKSILKKTSVRIGAAATLPAAKNGRNKKRARKAESPSSNGSGGCNNNNYKLSSSGSAHKHARLSQSSEEGYDWRVDRVRDW